MKLIASMVVRNEADRYLSECLDHLLDFCDEIRVLDDASDDASGEILAEHPRVETLRSDVSTFYTHEGMTRQKLLDWTMEGEPTHILAIDADEFVTDGQRLRAALELGSFTGVWKLTMTEIWKADTDWLYMRVDGAWKPRPVGIAYTIPEMHGSRRQIRRYWRMPDRALACGRVPVHIQMSGNRTDDLPTTGILHMGWACEADRHERHQRYVVHDGGQHHASKHLDSIMWGDDQVKVAATAWPDSLPKQMLLDRINRA